MRGWPIKVGVLVIVGGLSWLLTAFTFDPFMVVGSTEPAQIWGPPLGRAGTLAGAALLVPFVALAPRRWTVPSLAVWAVFLAIATHRIVERTDGVASDQWFGMTIQRTSRGNPAVEPSGPRCAVTRWRARYTDGAGRGFTSVSALPMTPLLPGAWNH